MREKFGSLMLVNHMVETVEIENTNNALSSLYEKPPTGTHSKAFRRAYEAANQVNNEIISAFKDIWEAQSQSKIQQGNIKIGQEDNSYVKEME
jgi:chromosome partitioning protein